MNFVTRTSPPDGSRGPAYWFIFQADKLLLRSQGDRVEVPLVAGIGQLHVAPVRQDYLGYFENADAQQIDCYCAEIAADIPLPDDMVAGGLRELYPQLGDALFAIAGRGVQINAFDRTHHFCGQCGTVMEPMAHERAKRCPHCGLVSYPRLSPAIIIAVVRHTEHGDQLLLARNHRFPAGRYSVIAGYVEPGESLEECAQREVYEEVGVSIKQLRYFGSQPWPFPNSLMIGFTAEYDGGELAVEEAELADARWFTADALPNLPPKMTIARQLIDWFLNTRDYPRS